MHERIEHEAEKPPHEGARQALAQAPDHVALMRQLQQGAGNAAVAAMLARQEAPPVTAPAQTPAPADGGTPPAGGETPPAAADPIADWAKKAVSTNAEHADWVLSAETHGFVTFWGDDKRDQLTSIKDGKKVHGVDPTKGGLLPFLDNLHALVKARADRWLADKTKPKEPIHVNSLIRSSGTGEHIVGGALDLGGFDFTDSGAPAQVLLLLKDLPAGKYDIGLPFQGDFFPKEKSLDERKKQAEAAATDGVPAAITEPSLVKFTGALKTATWDKDNKKWVDAKADGTAMAQLKSQALKDGIAELNKAGYTLWAFPDNDNHVHIEP